MLFLGFEPWSTDWWAQTDSLSNDGRPNYLKL